MNFRRSSVDNQCLHPLQKYPTGAHIQCVTKKKIDPYCLMEECGPLIVLSTVLLKNFCHRQVAEVLEKIVIIIDHVSKLSGVKTLC